MVCRARRAILEVRPALMVVVVVVEKEWFANQSAKNRIAGKSKNKLGQGKETRQDQGGEQPRWTKLSSPNVVVRTQSANPATHRQRHILISSISSPDLSISYSRSSFPAAMLSFNAPCLVSNNLYNIFISNHHSHHPSFFDHTCRRRCFRCADPFLSSFCLVFCGRPTFC